MTGSAINPFRPTRWEHQRDGHQLIWFTKTAETLASEKSTYIQGSRGSGKTTLLRSICWEDLAKNTSLRMQRKLADFDHIGVYIRFPDHISTTVPPSLWPSLYPEAPVPEIDYHRYFSLILELTCSERALEACHELRVLGFATISAPREIQVVQEIMQEYGNVARAVDAVPKTFAELARALRRVVRRMNDAAGRGTVQALSLALPEREPGELLTFIASRLTDAVRIKASAGERRPTFKFCLDDCEVLNATQQKSLNTLVRISRAPVSWVVSAVGFLFDTTETFLIQQPLTDADRRIVSLDERDDHDFRDLCQAVASLRLLFAVSEAARAEYGQQVLTEFFPLGEKFGHKDINDMMYTIARRSTSQMAVTLVNAARNLRVRHLPRRRRPARNIVDRTLPMYETYVLLHWQGRENAFKADISEKDVVELGNRALDLGSPSFEAWLRRKQRAALLQFAAKLGFRKLPLSGANIVVSLADGSIRDFLEIVGEIYEVYTRRHQLVAKDVASLDRFATSRTPVGADVQTDGIYAASEAYLLGAGTRPDRISDMVRQLVEGLAHYTAILQSDPSDPSVLGLAIEIRIWSKT